MTNINSINSITTGNISSTGTPAGYWSNYPTAASGIPYAPGNISAITSGTYTYTISGASSNHLELSEIRKKIENIEKMLGIVHTSSEHEDRWKELKELGDKYRALYEEIVEKEKIWELLQK